MALINAREIPPGCPAMAVIVLSAFAFSKEF